MVTVMPGYSDDQVRLLVRVARMYYEQGMRQGEIAQRLHISQPRVSRLLKRAQSQGIVRTIVTIPAGVHSELEEALESRFGLTQAIVVDADEATITEALGSAAAEYLATTLIGGERIGISSWSASLLAAVSYLRPFQKKVADDVVQLVGGLGDPRVQMQATRLIGQLSEFTGAEPVLLPTPAVLGSPTGATSLLRDATVSGVVQAWGRLTMALVGIGALEPSDLARESGNALPASERSQLEARGAVGDICFRFFAGDGTPINSDFDDRVIGISNELLRKIPRRVGVAGGLRKREAIRAALAGNWLTVLVTDRDSAEALLEAES